MQSKALPVSYQMTNIVATLRRNLDALHPDYVKLRDDSAKHIGHAGARNGGHYHLTIVADAFAGKTRLERHRMVNSQVSTLLQNGVHALAIRALSRQEAADEGMVY